MKKNEMKKTVEEEIHDLKKAVEELSQIIKEMNEKSEGRRPPTGVRKQILELLEKEDRPLTVKEVADLIGRAETTVSGYLLKLYEGGYLQRNSRLINVGETRRVRQLEYFVPQKKRRRWHYL